MRVTETRRKSLQARFNGTLSKGPITPQGKDNSSQAGITHGLTTHRTILATEDQAGYDAHLAMFLTRFQPTDPIEHMLITELAALRWKLHRAGVMQDSLLDLEIDFCSSEIGETFTEIDRPGLWAYAYRSLCDSSNSLRCIDSHQARLVRQYHRTFQHLQDLRSLPQTNPQTSPPTAEQKNALDPVEHQSPTK